MDDFEVFLEELIRLEELTEIKAKELNSTLIIVYTTLVCELRQISEVYKAMKPGLVKAIQDEYDENIQPNVKES